MTVVLKNIVGKSQKGVKNTKSYRNHGAPN